MMRSWTARPAAAAMAVLLTTGAARAQPPDPPRIDVSAGPRWTGGVSLSGDASETTSTGTSFRLFTTSTTLAGAASLDARVGIRITRRLRAMVSGGYGRPALRISAANDVENATAVTASERIQQFVIRGGASWALFPRGRLAPFIAGEVGYLRELHDAQTLVQVGRLVEIGGGATFPFTSNGGASRLAARVDARAILRSKGALDSGLHVAPAVGVGLSFGF